MEILFFVVYWNRCGVGLTKQIKHWKGASIHQHYIMVMEVRWKQCQHILVALMAIFGLCGIIVGNIYCLRKNSVGVMQKYYIWSWTRMKAFKPYCVKDFHSVTWWWRRDNFTIMSLHLLLTWCFGGGDAEIWYLKSDINGGIKTMLREVC